MFSLFGPFSFEIFEEKEDQTTTWRGEKMKTAEEKGNAILREGCPINAAAARELVRQACEAANGLDHLLQLHDAPPAPPKGPPKLRLVKN